jgi:hypothetical protein
MSLQFLVFQSGHSLNNRFNASFSALLASVANSKKISDCLTGLFLPARSPIATVLAAMLCFLPQRKSRHDQSCNAELSSCVAGK